MKLNLGANDRRIEGYLSVDIVPPADVIADLAAPWPWPDSSVESVLAYDVFEHIGNCEHLWRDYCCSKCNENVYRYNAIPWRHWSGVAHLMNELWRVLQPGGRAIIQVPNAAQGDGGFCDPTHVSYWTPSTFEYFVQGIAERERFRNSPYYGVKADFRMVSFRQTTYPRHWGSTVVEMLVELEAVK